MSDEKINYSIEVYSDYAIIKGKLAPDVLFFLLQLCQKEGFTHMIRDDNDSKGFKLFRQQS